MQVLLVEDDHSLARGLQQVLRDAGFTANHVGTGEAALYLVDSAPPDMVVLDLGLPDLDGMAVLDGIRKRNAALPVLILSARDALSARVDGLESGADDYLAKPFEIAELIARLRTMQRRLVTDSTRMIEAGPVILDTGNHAITVDGQPVVLSRREFGLLRALMENRGRVVPRHELEKRVYNWDDEIASNAIDVHIHHLRRKLPEDFIRTVRGVGYMIATP